MLQQQPGICEEEPVAAI